MTAVRRATSWGARRSSATQRFGAPGLTVRVRTARVAARTAAWLSRVLRDGSGLVIGGRVLLALAPRGPLVLSRGRRITLVSGTNGKTTTTALLAAALGGAGAVGANRDGANTSAGIAGTLATSDADCLVLEVDEGWLPWTIERTAPHIVVLGNLSRDQLSRHHEVGSLARSWRVALAAARLVVANADDPDVVWPALAARSQVWVSVGQHWTADSLVCPRCGSWCRHTDGDWRCDGCDLRRPRPDWWLEGDVLRSAQEEVHLDLHLPGSFNLANAALAVVAASTAGVSATVAAARLTAVESVAGRFQRRRTDGHELRMMLGKNPAGWLELLTLMAPDQHPVVLLFNADGVDGRDPSWLYDVSFSALRGRDVVVQGRRATDLLVRLELDGVAARQVPGRLRDALATLPPGHVDVVGNYTAFQAARTELDHG
ncbi:MAG: MurT ligase domain-containing protein [Nocardioides sp.]